MANNALKICTFNCSGLRDRIRLCSILRLIEGKKVDIAMLQETHITELDRAYIEGIWKGTVHIQGESTNSKGIMTLFSKNLDPENINLIYSEDRIMLSTYEKDKDTRFIIQNIYAPNSDAVKLHPLGLHCKLYPSPKLTVICCLFSFIRYGQATS